MERYSYLMAKIYHSSNQIYCIFDILDGGAVDPECGLEDNAHVYRQTIDRRQINSSVVLGLVDIEKNKNCYYRIQLLESNDQKL